MKPTWLLYFSENLLLMIFLRCNLQALGGIEEEEDVKKNLYTARGQNRINPSYSIHLISFITWIPQNCVQWARWHCSATRSHNGSMESRV